MAQTSQDLKNHLDQCGEQVAFFEPNLKKCSQTDSILTTIPGLNKTEGKFESEIIQNWFCRNCCSQKYSTCMDNVRLFDVYKTQCQNGLLTFETLVNDLAAIDLKNRKQLISMRRYFDMKVKNGQKSDILDSFLFIVKLAESADKILPRSIPSLTSGTEGSVTLSQHQCAVILANMFLGIGSNDLTFYGILSSSTPLGFEKVKFMMNYFETIKSSMPNGNISFRRTSGQPNMDISQDSSNISDLLFYVSTSLRIEQAAGCGQMDFANKKIGGGVLGRGSLQEEIRFLMCPEMMVSMVLFDPMNDVEAITIVGAQTYSSYSGYGHRLQWEELREVDAKLNRNRDQYGRITNELIAVDAKNFSSISKASQFEKENIDREIYKLLAGFTSPSSNSALPPTIVTGWWGCGAFGGVKQLKAIIQILAATISKRPLIFCTCGDLVLTNQLVKMVNLLSAKKVPTGFLYKMLVAYRNSIHFGKISLFDFIAHLINSTEQ